MDRHLRCDRARRCALVALAAGGVFAVPALGDDKSWNSNSGPWSQPSRWWPVGVPQAADRVFLGNIVGVENRTVRLDQMGVCTRLGITDGMTLDLDGQIMDVNGDTTVAGENHVELPEGTVVYHSRIVVPNVINGPELRTENLALTDHGRIMLDAGMIEVSDVLNIGEGCWIDGTGTISLIGTGTTFINDGTLSPDTDALMLIYQTGAGRFDLDGVQGGGRIWMNVQSSQEVVIVGDGLTDSFSGEIWMVHNSHLMMDLDEPWVADSASTLRVSGTVGPTESRLTGAPVTVAGHVQLDSGEATFRVQVPVTFAPTAVIDLNSDDRLDLEQATVINGGTFTLGDGSDVRFLGDTRIDGGDFTTFGPLIAQGAVLFQGPTEWTGAVDFSGVARQSGPASVTAATVINADIFDMDGTAIHAWDISSSLVINADALGLTNSNVASSLNIAGGFVGSLVVNLSDPDDVWTASGEVNLTGHPSLFVTRISGSPLSVTGDMTVSGRVNVSAPTTLGSSADVAFDSPAAALRLNSASTVFPTVGFTGSGTLQVGPTGEMRILSGTNLGTSGLINQGTLRIGSISGIATAGRFENTGTWEVEIGGYAAGTEHDRMVVAGGAGATATVGGTLDVRVVDDDGDGIGFQPVVGDTFTILTATGGVSSTLASTATSQANGLIYEWSVEVGPTSITLRLDDSHPPTCEADFNADGVVNSQDFFDFLAAFFVPVRSADVNGDGIVNSQDFFDYLVMFFKGCQ